MREADYREFSGLLDASCSLLSRGAYKPNSENTAMFFRALARYDIATVRAAFDAHLSDPERGRFVPTPSDVIAQIASSAAHDGRPGSDEAWAIAIGGRDEAETVVWTAEIAEAWKVAKPVLNLGDDVGARMAFREAYDRILAAARASATPAEWQVSLGFDPERCDRAIAAAVSAGKLLCDDVLRIAGPSGSFVQNARATMPQYVREQLLKLRDELTGPRDPVYVKPLDGAAMPEPMPGKFEPIAAKFLPPSMRPTDHEDMR